MSLLKAFLISLELLLFFYLVFVTAYNFMLSVAGMFSLKYRRGKGRKMFKIATLVPAYKEDKVIFETVRHLLRSTFPKDKFDVIVIADSLKADTIDKIAALPLKIVEVHFQNPTKVKALNAAFSALEEDYDIGVVLDADNLVSPDFLSMINNYFEAGYHSIQGQRKPKNADTNIAILDGLSEAVNNHLVRKGTCVFGGSSAIVGSGFAVDYKILKDTLSEMDAVGGFDKELEIKLLERGFKTVYAEGAIVYDEKVHDQKVFRNQRKRWIASQFLYLRKYLRTSIKALLKGNFALFNSAFLRYAQLPRFINMGLIFVTVVGFYFLQEKIFVRFEIYLFLFGLLYAAVFLSIPRAMYSRKLFMAGMALPVTFLNMFVLLFRLRNANKKYIHTPHESAGE